MLEFSSSVQSRTNFIQALQCFGFTTSPRVILLVAVPEARSPGDARRKKTETEPNPIGIGNSSRYPGATAVHRILPAAIGICAKAGLGRAGPGLYALVGGTPALESRPVAVLSCEENFARLLLLGGVYAAILITYTLRHTQHHWLYDRTTMIDCCQSP